MKYLTLLTLISCSQSEQMMFDWAESVSKKESMRIFTECINEYKNKCKKLNSDMCQDSVYMCFNDNTEHK